MTEDEGGLFTFALSESVNVPLLEGVGLGVKCEAFGGSGFLRTGEAPDDP